MPAATKETRSSRLLLGVVSTPCGSPRKGYVDDDDDNNNNKTITDKQNKYQELANEICAMWKQTQLK
jgi:hypothetical protein